MDDLLKPLAETGLLVEQAEEALAAGEATTASELLDAADEQLAALRARWPDLDRAQRAIVGATAAPLRARADDARRRLPRRSALSTATAVVDPEQEQDPEAA